MESNNGMRPQDISVLIAVILTKQALTIQELADLLLISKSGIFYSLKRSAYSGLYNESQKRVKQKTLFEFIKYGLPYAFPIQTGGLTKGIPTSISALPLSKYFTNDISYVWPSAKPTVAGMKVEPLYPSLPEAVCQNEILYEAFSLIDAVRIGNTREKQRALEILEQIICKKR